MLTVSRKSKVTGQYTGLGTTGDRLVLDPWVLQALMTHRECNTSHPVKLLLPPAMPTGGRATPPT